MQLTKNSIYPLLILIFLLGLGLRLYHLTKDDIWYDEAVSIQTAQKPVMEMLIIHPGQNLANYPPVYYLFLKGWMSIFGDSPPAARSFSVLCGVLTIPVMFGIGRILMGEVYGLITAFLLAISSFHLYYSQETRGYSLQIFLLCLSVYFFIRLVKEQKRYIWCAYVFFQILAVYVHIFSLFIWLSLFLFHIFYLWNEKPTLFEIPRKLSSQWVIGLGILPLIIFRIMYDSPDSVGWIEPFKFPFYRHTLIHLLFGIHYTYSQGMYRVGMSLVAVCFILSIYHLVRFGKRYNNLSEITAFDSFSTGLLSWCLFLIPIFLFTIFSLILHPIYVSWRYLVIVIPGFILIITQAFLLISWKWARVFMIILTTALFIFSYKANLEYPQKIGMKSVAVYVHNKELDGDNILFVPGYDQISFEYYYHGKVNNVMGSGQDNWFDAINKASMTQNRLWLVLNKESGLIMDCDNIYRFTVKVYGEPLQKTVLPPYSVEVYLFQRKSSLSPNKS